MFKKLSDLKKAQALQKIMASESVTKEKEGVTVSVSGDMKIEKIILNPDLDLESQEEILKSLINQAWQELQKKLAMKLFSETIHKN